jgi:hypothetical protein
VFVQSERKRVAEGEQCTLAVSFGISYYLSDMKMTATELYRKPAKVFAAADVGEVIIERLGIEYVLARKRNGGRNLYGALKGSILKDEGKPGVKWKALR